MRVLLRIKLLFFTLVGVQFPLTTSGQNNVLQPVILSSRWYHPAFAGDTLSTLKMVEEYKPDRIDWMYCDDSLKLSTLRKRSVKYSLAINPQIPDSLNYTVKGRIVDINGNKLGAPWMSGWKITNPYWGCVNSPDFKKVFYARSKQLIDLGAYGLFLDDARFNDHAVEWGGCYCSHCMAGFNKYLSSTHRLDKLDLFDYKNYLMHSTNRTVKRDVELKQDFKNYQRLSVALFLSKWKFEMTAYAKKPITFLTNNPLGYWSDIYNIFDVGIAELRAEDLYDTNWISKLRNVKSTNKVQYFTLPSHDESLNIRAAILLYLEGSSLIIPWDVFAPLKAGGGERFYGRTSIFSKIYFYLREQQANSGSFTKVNSEASVVQLSSKDSEIKDEIIYKKESRFIILVECCQAMSSSLGESQSTNQVSAHAKKFKNSIIMKLSNGRKVKNVNVLYPDIYEVSNDLSEISFKNSSVLVEIII